MELNDYIMNNIENIKRDVKNLISKRRCTNYITADDIISEFYINYIKYNYNLSKKEWHSYLITYTHTETRQDFKTRLKNKMGIKGDIDIEKLDICDIEEDEFRFDKIDKMDLVIDLLLENYKNLISKLDNSSIEYYNIMTKFQILKFIKKEYNWSKEVKKELDISSLGYYYKIRKEIAFDLNNIYEDIHKNDK